MKPASFHILIIAGASCLLGPDSSAQHVGDAADDVRAALGSPSGMRQSGEQTVWVFESGVKVTIENGLVIEVHGPAVAIPSRIPHPLEKEPAPATDGPATPPTAEEPSATAPAHDTAPAKASAPAKTKGKAKAPPAGAASTAPAVIPKEQKPSIVKWILISAMIGAGIWLQWGNKNRTAVPGRKQSI